VSSNYTYQTIHKYCTFKWNLLQNCFLATWKYYLLHELLTYIRIYTYIYIYIHTHTHTHIHIITEMLNCKCMWIYVKLITMKIIFVTCYFVILCKILMKLLTFIGLCIVIYSYSKTNKMHSFLKSFILVKHSTCFGRSFHPSSGAQDCTYACCCMCSLELLMMDGKTVQNM
jgi:hypothetical protein